MQFEIKQLKWVEEEPGLISATPEGLRWNYNILTIEHGFELTLLDDAANHNKNEYKIYLTLEQAQQAANKHYHSTINNLIKTS